MLTAIRKSAFETTIALAVGASLAVGLVVVTGSNEAYLNSLRCEDMAKTAARAAEMVNIGHEPSAVRASMIADGEPVDSVTAYMDITEKLAGLPSAEVEDRVMVTCLAVVAKR